MSKLEDIPVVVSGTKFETEQGFRAVKNGIKQNPNATPIPRGQKPSWLRAKLPTGKGYNEVKHNVREHRLSTVCEESMCPNIGECWNNGTATIMLMGSVCTRACRFCAVDTGNPHGWLDQEEPANTAESVRLMGLKYVVLTSVDRDDLLDGGAAHYAACVRAVKEVNPRDGGGGTDAGLRRPDRRRGDGGGFGSGSFRPECGDGAAPDPQGPRPPRGL